MRYCGFIVAIFLLYNVSISAQQNSAFHLKDGDKVVFFGDSITDQRLYTVYTEAYVVTRFPRMKVNFIHSGWTGDTASGGVGGNIDTRIERDVSSYKPTVMTVLFGMNDGQYRPFDQGIFQTFQQGIRHIVDKSRALMPGIRITLLQPTPFDDITRNPNFEGGYNVVMLKYGQAVREIAQQMGTLVADFNGPITSLMEDANGVDPKMAQNLIWDRVHPGAGAQIVMAEQLLKAWNAPSIVSATILDADKKRISETKNCVVSELKWLQSAISWRQLDNSLPFPYDLKNSEITFALRSSDVVENLNQQIIQITGLKPARYTLKIDGEEVGAYTEKDLSAGINLARHLTPMFRQAMEVLNLTVRHNDIHFVRWRNVQIPLQGTPTPNVQKTLDSMDSLETGIIASQRAKAIPRPHRFELSPGS